MRPTPITRAAKRNTFDSRLVPADQKFGFALEKTAQDGLITVRLRWANALNPNSYVLPELPSGTHRIEWRFEKDGTIKTCGYDFTIKDCQPPTMACNPGVSINILPVNPPQILLWATEFLQSAADNYTPLGQLQYGIRRPGTGTGFPVNSPTVQFTCGDLGIQPLEVWTRDLAGNADFCETYVIVQDNLNACNGSGTGSFDVEVCAVNHCNGAPIPDVDFNVIGSHPALPPFGLFNTTDSTGCISLDNSIPVASNLTITPNKDDNPLNGVTTYDLVLMSRHILGLEPLNSPYKMIAADVNKSGIHHHFRPGGAAQTNPGHLSGVTQQYILAFCGFQFRLSQSG